MHSSIISWQPDGESFVIHSQSLLGSEVLVKYFRHSNFTSFIRQLNLYGFKKIQNNFSGICFSHKCFKRDQVRLLSLIKCKKYAVDKIVNRGGNESTDLDSLKEEIAALKLRNQQLEEYLNEMILTNNKIIEDSRALALEVLNAKFANQETKR